MRTNEGEFMVLNAIDLFSGCGGLSVGLEQAKINVLYAVELDPKIANTFTINHPDTHMINDDIRNISDVELKKIGKDINIVAGCPPCQGFSQMNRKNMRSKYVDQRNLLILEYYRAVKAIEPEFIMLENVPEIVHFEKFKSVLKSLKKLGYNLDSKIINVKDFGVPQNRKRLVLLGSKHYEMNFPTCNDSCYLTVRDAIGNLKTPSISDDPMQKVYSHHTERIKKMISLIPKNGGSRRDLPYEYWLECHKKKNIGYSDVYGRMSWDTQAPTITGGCLSPSKGRFLHPEQDRSISIREASLLQSFPLDYKFDKKCSKSLLAQMVGNAIPPKISKFQGEYIRSIYYE